MYTANRLSYQNKVQPSLYKWSLIYQLECFLDDYLARVGAILISDVLSLLGQVHGDHEGPFEWVEQSLFRKQMQLLFFREYTQRFGKIQGMDRKFWKFLI